MESRTATAVAEQGAPVRAADLRVKVFADGADLEGIGRLAADPTIAGFTTNPTLMNKAGVKDYEEFATAALELIGDRPISFEVFTDDFAEMAREARAITTWGDNVYVKIPVTDTKGNPADDLVRELAHEGVKLNVTGLFTIDQVNAVCAALDGGAPACVSLFAGRIADAGVDPIPIVTEAVAIVEQVDGAELIWASPREILNVVQADQTGCHIITVTHDLLAKLPSLGKDLTEFSLDTVKMFHRDATDAGYEIRGG